MKHNPKTSEVIYVLLFIIVPITLCTVTNLRATSIAEERDNSIRQTIATENPKFFTEEPTPTSLAGIFYMYLDEDNNLTLQHPLYGYTYIYNELKPSARNQYINFTKDKSTILKYKHPIIYNNRTYNPQSIKNTSSDDYDFYPIPFEPTREKTRVAIIYDNTKDKVFITPAQHNLGEAVRRYKNSYYNELLRASQRDSLAVLFLFGLMMIIYLVIISNNRVKRELKNSQK